MDLAGRPCGLPDFPAQFPVECSPPLAIHRIDAEHQGGGSRCCAPALAILLPADAAGASSDRAHLDYWSDCAFLLAATKDLSSARLELSGLLHPLLCFARQELLPCSYLLHAAGGGRGDHRERN